LYLGIYLSVARTILPPHLLRQRYGVKRAKKVNSSKRPVTIHKERSSFPPAGIKAKFLTGPTLANPGPVIFKVVATEERALIISNPIRVIIRAAVAKIIR